MKIVVNSDFGGYGFNVSDEFKDMVYYYASERTSPKLIDFVENNPDECGDLTIAIIPDSATDFDIIDDDGMETIVYVVDGKLHYRY